MPCIIVHKEVSEEEYLQHRRAIQRKSYQKHKDKRAVYKARKRAEKYTPLISGQKRSGRPRRYPVYIDPPAEEDAEEHAEAAAVAAIEPASTSTTAEESPSTSS